MRYLLFALALAAASPALAQEAPQAEPAPAAPVPRAQVRSVDDLVGPAPSAQPALPAAAASSGPSLQREQRATSPGTTASDPPQIQPRGEELSRTRDTQMKPPTAMVAAPLTPQDPTAALAPRAGDAPAASGRPIFAWGVVLKREGDRLILVGDRGFVHEYELPPRAHLVNISGAGIAEPADVNNGDFVALIGEEAGTGLPLIAYLKLGQQPSARYSDMSQSIEGCYEHAVAALARQQGREIPGDEAQSASPQ